MLKYQVVIKPIWSGKILTHERHSEEHRVDGPARIWDWGYLVWYQYSIQYEVKQYVKI